MRQLRQLLPPFEDTSHDPLIPKKYREVREPFETPYLFVLILCTLFILVFTLVENKFSGGEGFGVFLAILGLPLMLYALFLHWRILKTIVNYVAEWTTTLHRQGGRELVKITTLPTAHCIQHFFQGLGRYLWSRLAELLVIHGILALLLFLSQVIIAQDLHETGCHRKVICEYPIPLFYALMILPLILIFAIMPLFEVAWMAGVGLMVNTYPRNSALVVMFNLLVFWTIRTLMSGVFLLIIGGKIWLLPLTPFIALVWEWLPAILPLQMLSELSEAERMAMWGSSLVAVILAYVILPLLLLEFSIRVTAYRSEKRP